MNSEPICVFITDQTHFNEIEGIESLEYLVFVGRDIDDNLRPDLTSKFPDQQEAYDYGNKIAIDHNYIFEGMI